MTDNGFSADLRPMAPNLPEPVATGLISNPRWSRTNESAAFFIDEEELRRWFYGLMASGALLIGALSAGLWRLRRAALAPPIFVGIAHGQVFSGRAEGIADVRQEDFDQQLADTVEVLFSRTEKGLPPEIADFCAPEAVAAVDQAYRDAGSKYPAGYVQSLALLEAKAVENRPGRRRLLYRGLLSSRSVAAAQTSPIYLECTFVMRTPTALNLAGWRLTQVDALSRDDYYKAERERATRAELELGSKP
jgi:hypothetical protein